MSGLAFALVVAVVGVVVSIPILLLQARARTVALIVQVMAVITIASTVLYVGDAVIRSLFLDETVATVRLALKPPAVEIPGVELVWGDARILAADGGTATYTIAGLTWQPRLLLAAAALLQGAVVVYFAVVVARLAGNVRRGLMFKGLARLMVRGGVLLFATYVTWTLLAGIGEAMAAEQALRIAGWTYEGSDPFLQEVFMGDSLAVFGLPVPADWNVTFETWPILIACALVLLGAAFSAGERMQEDTEGLV